MATYKAEFLSHHYARRLRPLAHYSMGLLPYWSPVLSAAPGLSNALTQGRLLGPLAARAAGLTPHRRLPRIASRSFRSWFRSREDRPRDGERVVLWVDTFTDTFQPEVGVAAVEVLERLGYRVDVPVGRVCCGLPMLTNGMLGAAKRKLRSTLSALADDASAGVPIVGLEPSCTAVLRHDLRELFPHDHDALRVSAQTVTLAELLAGRDDLDLPEVAERAIVQGHCHHHAVLGMDADLELMGRVGLDAELLDSGCCGLAGSFGFEKGHHDVAMACGERVLFPAVRAAEEDTLVVADGFSCRMQIAEGTPRHALHLAQVLHGGLLGRPLP
jgi:Fe-S oxidoreductase